MHFGPFSPGRCFRIEECDAYTKIQGRGVKVVEFIWLREGPEEQPVLWVVEAKSSAPKPGNKQDFPGFIAAFREKCVNAMSMVVSACLHRNQSAANELPGPFRTLDLSVTDFRFILVVKGHKPEWLVSLQEALVRELSATLATWGLSPPGVIVLNDDLAQCQGLIQHRQAE